MAAARCDPDNGGLKLPPGFCASVFADNLGQARHSRARRRGIRQHLALAIQEGRARAARRLPGRALRRRRQRRRRPRAALRRVERRCACHRRHRRRDPPRLPLRRGERPHRALPAARGRAGAEGRARGRARSAPTTGGTPSPFAITRERRDCTSTRLGQQQLPGKDRATSRPATSPARIETRAGRVAVRQQRCRSDAGPDGCASRPALRNADASRSTRKAGLSPRRTAATSSTRTGRERFNAGKTTRACPPRQSTARRGADYGWPYCYYDAGRQSGTSSRPNTAATAEGGRCAASRGRSPRCRRTGRRTAGLLHAPRSPRATAAARSSPTTAPRNQAQGAAGYNVVFVPLTTTGEPRGPMEMFADGFAGVKSIQDPRQARHRPSGLAVGPGGALYVSDDQRGRIWRIVHIRD